MARRKVHWSEVMICSCGAKFTDYAKEAYHRHNFPALCKKKPARDLERKAPKSGVKPDQT